MVSTRATATTTVMVTPPPPTTTTTMAVPATATATAMVTITATMTAASCHGDRIESIVLPMVSLAAATVATVLPTSSDTKPSSTASQVMMKLQLLKIAKVVVKSNLRGGADGVDPTTNSTAINRIIPAPNLLSEGLGERERHQFVLPHYLIS